MRKVNYKIQCEGKAVGVNLHDYRINATKSIAAHMSFMHGFSDWTPSTEVQVENLDIYILADGTVDVKNLS